MVKDEQTRIGLQCQFREFFGAEPRPNLAGRKLEVHVHGDRSKFRKAIGDAKSRDAAGIYLTRTRLRFARRRSGDERDAIGAVRCKVVKEETLRAFFNGGTDAEALDREAVESSSQVGRVVRYRVEDMDEDFEVTREMLLKLCDAFLSGALSPKGLEAVGFMMEASDRFDWADSTITEVLGRWSSPEIEGAITEESVARCRELLVHEQ